MPGTNRLMSEEASVNIGALQQRVFGLENSQRNLADSFTSLASRVETLFANLSSKIEEKSRPQYPLLISIGMFGLAVLTSVGWLAYSPIRDGQAEMKVTVSEMAKAIAASNDRLASAMERANDRFVTIRELDQRSGRTRQDIDRLNTDLNAQELGRRRELEQAAANLQRQIDDQKKAFGDTFSLRDALQQMQRRIDQLEAARRSS